MDVPAATRYISERIQEDAGKNTEDPVITRKNKQERINTDDAAIQHQRRTGRQQLGTSTTVRCSILFRAILVNNASKKCAHPTPEIIILLNNFNLFRKCNVLSQKGY